MKKNILAVVVALLAFGCSKGDDELQKDLIGTWIWMASHGGFAGVHETPENTGEERKIIITPGSLKSYRNGELILEQNFKIDVRESMLFNEPRKMLIMENDFRYLIRFEGEKLILKGDCNDCFTNEYLPG